MEVENGPKKQPIPLATGIQRKMSEV